MAEKINMSEQIGELAFEKGFFESPQQLWRVRCFCQFVTREGTRAIAHTEYFMDEVAVELAVERLKERGADKFSVTRYEVVSQ